MELSSTSKTLWCKPRSSGSPIYIPGRLRTASSPSSLSILDASYFSGAAGGADAFSITSTAFSSGINSIGSGTLALRFRTQHIRKKGRGTQLLFGVILAPKTPLVVGPPAATAHILGYL